MTVMLEYDYGQKSRGPSGDKLWFFKNLKKQCKLVEPFWFDGYLKDTNALQKDLSTFAEKVQPDLIFFIPYTDQFDTVTLDLLRAKFKTVAWFGDDHWRFDTFTRKYAPHFSHSITTDPYAEKKYQAIGIKPILSEWAAEPIANSDRGESAPNYQYDVSFVGTKNEVRKWFIDRLKSMGIAVDCFGSGWSNGRVTEAEIKSIFLNSRINLNLSNSVPQDISFVFAHPRNFARWVVSKKRAEQVKARNFEIPLEGGFQLTQYALGLERHLEIGREVAVFTSPSECAAQIEYYLSNESARAQIAAAGQKRAIKDHTYERRIEAILTELFESRAVGNS